MKSVVMIGPDPDAKGGMASVLAVYREHGLFAGKLRYRLLPTATEGGMLRKLRVAIWAAWRFAFLLIAGQVRLLHVHGASHGSFWRKRLFMRLARAFGIPVVFHLHGGEFRQFIDQRLPPASRVKALDCLKASSLIYCLNEDMANWLRTRVGHVPVKIMPNPIDLRRFAPGPEKRETSLLFLGRLEKEKGVLDLLEAFSTIAQERPAIRLLLCGIGAAECQLKQRAEQLGIASQVSFPGWVDGDRKSALLQQAGAFVLPSYAEGMPMAVLEAMASGLPVVASRVGAVTDMLDNGACGFLVTPGDIGQLRHALLAALDTRQSREPCQRALKRVRDNYSAEVVIAQLRWQHEKLLP